MVLGATESDIAILLKWFVPQKLQTTVTWSGDEQITSKFPKTMNQGDTTIIVPRPKKQVSISGSGSGYTTGQIILDPLPPPPPPIVATATLRGKRVFLIYCGDVSSQAADRLRKSLVERGASFSYDHERCTWAGGGVGFNVVHYNQNKNRASAEEVASITGNPNVASTVANYPPTLGHDILIGLCPNSTGTSKKPTSGTLTCKLD
jgi:hypothetical protein